MRRWLWSVGVSVGLSVACGPSTPADPPSTSDGSGGSTSPVDTGAESGATTAATTTTATGDTTTATASTGPGPDTGSTTEDEPDSVCDPQPEEVIGGLFFDDAFPPDRPPQNPYVYVDCTIDDIAQVDDSYTLQLSCADGPHSLTLWSSIHPTFPGGPFELTVHWTYQTFGGGDLQLVLRDAGGVVLAAGYSPAVPGDSDIPVDFFAPLSVERLPDVCRIEPEQPNDTSFLSDCYLVQRQALRFELDGSTQDVFDHQHSQLGPYDVVVQNAEARHDISCSDTSPSWYSWLMAYPFLE